YIQEWLFFGLMDEFTSNFGIFLPPNDFVRVNGEGVEIITTTHLPSYLMQLAEAVRRSDLTFQERKERSEKAGAVLVRACHVLSHFGSSIDFDQDVSEPFSTRTSLFLSCSILVETLFSYVHVVYFKDRSENMDSFLTFNVVEALEIVYTDVPPLMG